MSERFTVLQLVNRLHRGEWDYEHPKWAAALHHLAEVADAVERLEAENRDLKRRLEALEQLVGTLPGVQRVEIAADTTKICPQCWGKKFWKEAPANDPGNFKHYVCGTCQGSGRVKA